MDSVLYYSNTGCSLAVARYVATKTGFVLQDMRGAVRFDFGRVFVVFPVHCQSIPMEVEAVLRRVRAESVILIATYGRMSYGRVLWDAGRLVKGNIRGGAYVPTRHSYVEGDAEFTEYEKLDGLIGRIDGEGTVEFPKSERSVFASFFPKLRSRIGVRIVKGEECDGCGVCNGVCENIDRGVPNGECARCLRCVSACPRNALGIRLGVFMRWYLRRWRRNELVVYV